MYDEDVLHVPADENEMWELLRRQFEHAAQDLLNHPLETRASALENRFYREVDGRFQRDGLSVIRYRSISEEMDQRGHFIRMAHSLLPYVGQALDDQRLTPEFVQQWGKLMFCHGYVVSHIFDDSDDLALARAGLRRGKQRSKNAQRKWIANIMIPLIDSGMKREDAENQIVKHVEAALADEKLRGGFAEEWFRPIVTRGYLAATYDAKHFAIKEMRKLTTGSTTDIPPLPKIP